MDIEFDPNKDATNIAKHGVSLADAAALEWDTALTVDDDRQNYGEKRQITMAYIGNRLFCAVYTIRGNHLRMISLRKANAREIQRYAEA